MPDKFQSIGISCLAVCSATGSNPLRSGTVQLVFQLVVMYSLIQSKLLKILLRSGSVWRYLLAAPTPVYIGGVIGAPALPLNAPPAPLPLGAD